MRCWLLLALAGCYGDRVYSDIKIRDDLYKVMYQDKLIALSAARVEERFNVWLWADEEPPHIYWTDTPCPYFEGNPPAVIHNNRCYYGLMWDCGEIYVALHPDGPAHGALAHELGHCWLLRMGFGGDPHHLLDEWWVWMNEIAAEGQRRGW